MVEPKCGASNRQLVNNESKTVHPYLLKTANNGFQVANQARNKFSKPSGYKETNIKLSECVKNMNEYFYQHIYLY